MLMQNSDKKSKRMKERIYYKIYILNEIFFKLKGKKGKGIKVKGRDGKKQELKDIDEQNKGSQELKDINEKDK